MNKAGEQFYIKVKSRNNVFSTTNFKVINKCATYSVTPVSSPNVHYVPAVPNTPPTEVVVDLKTILNPADYSSGTGSGSDPAVCPITYTL